MTDWLECEHMSLWH